MLTDDDIQRLVHITRRTLSPQIRWQQPHLVTEWRETLHHLQEQSEAINDTESVRIFQGLLAVIDGDPLPPDVSHPALLRLHDEVVRQVPADRPRFHTDLIEQAIAVCTTHPAQRNDFAEELQHLLQTTFWHDGSNLQTIIFYLALLNVVEGRPLMLPTEHPLYPVFREMRDRIDTSSDDNET